MSTLKEIKKVSKKIKNKVDALIEFVSIFLIFLLGIGTTKLLARIFSKSFLEKEYPKGSWKIYQRNKDSLKMY